MENPNPQYDPVNDVKITVTSNVASGLKISPGKLMSKMFIVALAWAIIGLVSGGLLESLEELAGIWLIFGGLIIAGFIIFSLHQSVVAFRSKQNSKGVQFLLLIVLLPIIGVGVGCGTCLIGADIAGF